MRYCVLCAPSSYSMNKPQGLYHPYRVHGPYTLLGLQDLVLVYGPIFMIHMVLKERAYLRLAKSQGHPVRGDPM